MDIERIGRGLDVNQMSSLLNHRLVRKGLMVVAHAGFWASPQFELSKSHIGRIRSSKITQLANHSQLTCPNIDESLLEFGLRNLNLSHSSINFLVKMLLALLPPDALVNPLTGEPLSVRDIVICRFQKLKQQIQTRRSIEKTTSDCAVPVGSPDRPA